MARAAADGKEKEVAREIGASLLRGILQGMNTKWKPDERDKVGATSTISRGLSGAAVSAATGGGFGTGMKGIQAIPYAGAAVTAIHEIFQGIGNAVQTANPALMEQVSIAFSEISATIGQALVPVVRMFVPLLQAYGDYMASIIPSQDVLNELFTSFQPIIDTMIQLLQMLAPAMKAFVTWLAKLLAWLSTKVGEGLKFVGLGDKSKGFTASARGAASAPGSIVGVEDLGRNLITSAFSQGASVQGQIARATERTAAASEKLAGMPPAPAIEGAF